MFRDSTITVSYTHLAHAVISRSWLLAQIQKNKEITAAQANYSAFTQTDEELIRWYDREDHKMCRRYSYFPAIVGILFIIGLISSAYSAAGLSLIHI